jgi:DNA-binding CsgD family transcriptional regulator
MIDGMLDMLTIGVACIRLDGEVMYANKAALEMFSNCGVLLGSSSFPIAKQRIQDSTLKKLRFDKQETLVIRNQNCELQIQIAPFNNTNIEHDSKIERRSGAMLILHESGRVALPSLQQLKSLYGLTHAEARIAIKLCEGNTPAECAKNMGVSITTIRTQLRALMDKTHSHRQAELLTKLLSSPSASVNTD